MTVQQTTRAAARSAFTLMEVLVVVAILVVLAGTGGVIYSKYMDDAKKDVAFTKAKTLSDEVQHYKIKTGDFPADLSVLLMANGGALEADALTDPWGGTYQYNAGGQNNGGSKPDVWTTSPDGQTIGNWTKH
jgi:general secretion pathway protein G